MVSQDNFMKKCDDRVAKIRKVQRQRDTKINLLRQSLGALADKLDDDPSHKQYILSRCYMKKFK